MLTLLLKVTKFRTCNSVGYLYTMVLSQDTWYQMFLQADLLQASSCQETRSWFLGKILESLLGISVFIVSLTFWSLNTRWQCGTERKNCNLTAQKQNNNWGRWHILYLFGLYSVFVRMKSMMMMMMMMSYYLNFASNKTFFNGHRRWREKCSNTVC